MRTAYRIGDAEWGDAVIDWWRAKLILIAAFLCLDLVLVWQVWHLRGFVGSGSIPPALPASAGADVVPTQLPELDVQTVGWQESWLRVLTDWTCNPSRADDRRTSPSIQCTSATDGGRLDWYNGLLEYSNDLPVRTLSAAQDEAKQVIARVDPSLLPGLQSGPALWDPNTQTRSFAIVERYDSWSLYNGRWMITAGPRGFDAKRWWIQVKGPVPPSKPLISKDQANSTVKRLYGQQAMTAPDRTELGYYYPDERPPVVTTPNSGALAADQSTDWYLKPVYMVHLDQDECVYVDAWSGEPVDGMHQGC